MDEYWNAFDDLARRSGYPVGLRRAGYLRWSGLPFRFQLGAYGPRVRRVTGNEEMSVELIRDGEGPAGIENHLRDWLPLVRTAWGDDLDIRPGGKQFKIDASASAHLEDRQDWTRQHRWLLSGVVRLDLIFRPILLSAPPA